MCLQAIFRNDCTNLYFQQQHTVSPFCVIITNICLMITAVLTGIRRFITVVQVCISLMISNVEHLFMYLLKYRYLVYLPFVYLLWKNVSLGLLTLKSVLFCFVLLLSCISLLYIQILPPYQIEYSDTFSYFLGHLFILLIVYFAVKMLFSLMWSYLLIFAFVFFTFAYLPKKKIIAKTIIFKQISPYVFFQKSYVFLQVLHLWFNPF